MPLFRLLRASAPLWLPPALAVAGLLALWEVTARAGLIPPFLLPAPSAVAAAALAVPAPQWLGHVWATLRIVLLGFAAAVAISLPLAVAISRFALFRRSIYPILLVIQSTPIVAIAPILVVTLGAGDLPRVVITAMIAFFPIVVGTSTGLLQCPDELIELSRSLGATTGREYRQIRLPYALPHLFSALRVAITLAVIGAVVAEFVAADEGVGYFIRTSTAFFRIPLAFAGLALLSALTLALFGLVGLVQRLFFPHSLAASDARRSS